MKITCPVLDWRWGKQFPHRPYEETLRASIQHLISYRRTLPLTSSFGDGTTSSSDGIRFGMAASDLHARHLPRYFGMRRGVTLYNHVNNRGDQYWIDVVNCLMHEATYVLDFAPRLLLFVA